jgi:hypothetical protein
MNPMVTKRYGLCPERAPSGPYRGYVCCGRLDHFDGHIVTNGSPNPPYYVVVYEWPQAPKDSKA